MISIGIIEPFPTTIFRGNFPWQLEPKLHPFKDRKANIKFVSLLSDGDIDSRGDGHVFEVIIASRRYALKIVSSRLQYFNGATQIL
jgi:hypothetical protein